MARPASANITSSNSPNSARKPDQAKPSGAGAIRSALGGEAMSAPSMPQVLGAQRIQAEIAHVLSASGIEARPCSRRTRIWLPWKMNQYAGLAQRFRRG